MSGHSLSDYVNQFYRLLPSGPLWPTQDLSSDNWLAYIRAMVSEFQRADSKVNEWLADYFPDATVTQLEDWERILSLKYTLASFGIDIVSLSTAQRQALVLATIRLAPFTLSELEGMATALGYTATIVQPARATRYAGFLSGQRYGGAGHARGFLYEYMVNISPDPDDMTHANWQVTGAAITPDDARAPDGTLTADLVATSGSAKVSVVNADLGMLVAGDVIQVSAWVKNDGSSEGYFRFLWNQTGGSPSLTLSPVAQLPFGENWLRYEYRFDVVTATAYQLDAFFSSASHDAHIWGYYVGVVDPLMEYSLDRAKPVHTTALPRVIGDTQSWPLTYP